jgi:hypothetical protein
MEKYGFIYIWYDRKRKMYYIGSHWGSEDDGYICSSNRMRDAYRRRPDDFKRRILVSSFRDRKTLLEHEEVWLKKAERKKNRYYNIKFVTSHVQYPIKHWSYNLHKKEVVSRKISLKLLGRTHSEISIEKMKQRKHSDETKQKIRDKHLGFIHSQETKNKMSKSRIGNQWGKGAVRDKQFRENVSKFHTGKINSPETIEKMRAAKRLWWEKRKLEKNS